MTHQFSRRDLFSLIIPLIADSFLSILIGMVDTMMVANVGEAAVSGVSLVDSISNLLVTVFSAFATGGAVVVAQFLGRENESDARLSAKNLLYVALFISMLMALFGLLFRSYIIDFFFGTIETEVKFYTEEYFVPILISYPFLAIYSSLTALSRAENRSIRTMFVSLMMNIINIGGNAILIYGYGLGPKGAGIASLFSRIAGCLVMLVLMSRGSDHLSLKGILRGPVSIPMISRILRIALPSGIEGAAFHVGKIMVQSLASSLGTSAIAINAVASNFNAFSNIPGNGINLAMITVIGQCMGRKNYKDVKFYAIVLTAAAYAATLIVDIPFFMLTPQVVAFYGLHDATAAAAIPICQLCLVACSLVWPLAFTLPAMLKATGDVRYILFASFSSMWIFRVGGAYFMVRILGMGIEAIWYAMYLDWLFRGLLFFIRVKSGKWQTKNVI